MSELRQTKGNKEREVSVWFRRSKESLCFLCCLWFEEVLTFRRNPELVSVLYIGERPEMTSHDEEPKKAKTSKIKSTKGTKDEP